MRWHAGERFAGGTADRHRSKDEARAVGDDAAEQRAAAAGAELSRRARTQAERRGRRRWDSDGASAAAMAGWFRAEPMAATRGASAPARTAAVAAARAVDRVLIGAGPDGAQARIRIGTGALGGTEIQLSSTASGHTVEARLLTHAASSRQTLSVVMDEIRSRLRDKGIVLSTAAPAARPPAAGARPAAWTTIAARAVGRVGGAGPVNALPFDLGSCPRVRAWQARATRAALRTCALLPERWSIELPPLGSATMSFAGIDADAGGGDGVELAVSFGAGAGSGGRSSRCSRSAWSTRCWAAALCSRRRERSGRPRRASWPACSRRCSIASAAACNSARFRPGSAETGRWQRFRFVWKRRSASGWLRLTPPAGGLPPRRGWRRDLAGSARPRFRSRDTSRLRRPAVPAGALAGWPWATRSCSTAWRRRRFAVGRALDRPRSRWRVTPRRRRRQRWQADQVDDARRVLAAA